MMKPILIPTLLLALIPACAFGQSKPGGPPPDPLAGALDADRDRVISEAEIDGAAESLLALDVNGDGELDESELRPQPPEGGDERERPAPPEGEEGRMPPSPLLVALDADEDGTISAAEIAGAPEALAKLDRNDDGELTPRELRPKRRRGGADEEGDEGEGPGRPPHGPPPGGPGGRR